MGILGLWTLLFNFCVSFFFGKPAAEEVPIAIVDKSTFTTIDDSSADALLRASNNSLSKMRMSRFEFSVSANHKS